MKLIFTRNTSPVSKAIRWGLDEPCSHFGVVFDDKIVFHSNFYGAHIEWFKTFQEHNDIVFELDYDFGLEEEEKIYKEMIDTANGEPYDFKALAYFAVCVVQNRWMGKELPTTNEWQDSKAVLCTGMAAKLPPELFPELQVLKDAEIVSPYQLYLVLRAAKKAR